MLFIHDDINYSNNYLSFFFFLFFYLCFASLICSLQAETYTRADDLYHFFR